MKQQLVVQLFFRLSSDKKVAHDYFWHRLLCQHLESKLFRFRIIWAPWHHAKKPYCLFNTFDLVQIRILPTNGVHMVTRKTTKKRRFKFYDFIFRFKRKLKHGNSSIHGPFEIYFWPFSTACKPSKSTEIDWEMLSHAKYWKFAQQRELSESKRPIKADPNDAEWCQKGISVRKRLLHILHVSNSCSQRIDSRAEPHVTHNVRHIDGAGCFSAFGYTLAV